MLESYMGGLKRYIKHEFFLKQLENVMKAMQYSYHIQAKNKATQKTTIGTYAGNIGKILSHKEMLPQPTWISQN